MTEASYPVTATHGHGFPPPQLTNGVGAASHRHAAPAAGVSQEDDEISCICNNPEDDGLTVACDLCNKWQHQLCYYPEFEDQSLPDDLQHFCVRCKPRPLDVGGAIARQTVRKEEQASLINGVKRPSSKSHKKKPPKDIAYTNGWPMDKSRHDRNSASPRDQPPPAKRAKTNHRSSESVATLKGHSRKRNASTAIQRRSLSRSPDLPLPIYSDSFVACYKDHWDVTNANLHNSITVTNALSNWLSTNDDEFRKIHNCEKPEVLQRWDGDLEDIPGKAQIAAKTIFDDRVGNPDGTYPQWEVVTVNEAVASGAYIGELKGHVGFKEEYFADEANRWDLLYHPEPFVFFHPKLPIYVDARNEGTTLRYVRRSCAPNAQLNIIVTDQTDYRFCFMATKQIEPGEEIAVSWDTFNLGQYMVDLKNGVLSMKDMDRLCQWVSTVMANCGPCACGMDDSCMMYRFDRRGSTGNSTDEAPPVKMPKVSKKKKAAPQISPLDTHVNSRSGSEARKVEPDDDQTDSRSVSGSGRGSASRDNTPHMHHAATMPELSERERRKVAKEEEIFRRQEEERSGKQGKKKRTSGGSTLNTPSEPKSKHSGFGAPRGYADAGTSKQAGLPSKPGRKPKNAPKAPPKTIIKTVKRPKPDYTDSAIQCDMDKEEANAPRLPTPRKPFVSLTTRLLQRCALNNSRRRSSQQTSSSSSTENSTTTGQMELDQKKAQSPASVQSPTPAEPRNIMDLTDTEMQDAGIEDPSSQAQEPPKQQPNGAPTSRLDQSSLPINPPAPPWPSQQSHTTRPPEPSDHEIDPHNKGPGMHIIMPPPAPNPFASSNLSLSGSGSLPTATPNVAGSAIASTPGPLLPPNLISQTSNTSPLKKKMSLSDYSQRRKAKDKENVETKTGDRESSPASVASGPVVPPLQGQSSEQAVEDSAMEDAVPQASA